MKKDSIIFTITITFIISLILILMSFMTLYKGVQKREEHFIFKRDMDVARMFMREYRFTGLTKELEENLKTMNFSIITDTLEQDKILNDKNIILKFVKNKHRMILKHFQLDNTYYVYIDTPRDKLILHNDNKSTNVTIKVGCA